ncbi:unnamed protein product [Strongylus vulgaris]|uniref:Uncharacterized protein n=1 Tax=Strongylus vulgaris TaxID=40348 RepID=A0A3P7IFW8_STRVU|nr:unnamed protein product [Strongylus vulgaris]
MSDRLCIETKGRKAVYVSDSDLLSCCGAFCGFGNFDCVTGLSSICFNLRCRGGSKTKGWLYFNSTGLCTGGAYGDKTCCKPYVFYPCKKYENQPYYGPCPENERWETPLCRKACQFKYRKNYEDDKIFAM